MFGANEDILYLQEETLEGHVRIVSGGRQKWGARGRMGSETSSWMPFYGVLKSGQ